MRHRRLRVGLCTALCLLSVCGCVSVRTVDPEAGPIVLEDDEGILLVHVDTDVSIHALWTSNAAIVGELPEGEHLQFLIMPAGRYRWLRLERQFNQVTFRWPLLDGDRKYFTVEPGVINYPGALLVGRPSVTQDGFEFSSDFYLTIDLVNRSSMMLETLEREHPSLLAQFPMRYSGWGRDDFVERYLALRKELAAAPADEASQ